jgi:integrase
MHYSWASEVLSGVLGDGTTGHQLRHRFATRAYSVDRDLLATAQLLGHSRPETTARYAQVPDGAALRAVLAAGGAS